MFVFQKDQESDMYKQCLGWVKDGTGGAGKWSTWRTFQAKKEYEGPMGGISKVQINFIHSFIHSLNPYSLPLEVVVWVGEGANDKNSIDNAIPNPFVHIMDSPRLPGGSMWNLGCILPAPSTDVLHQPLLERTQKQKHDRGPVTPELDRQTAITEGWQGWLSRRHFWT